MCYSDSRLAIKLCTKQISTTHVYAALILGIKELLGRDWDVEVLHTLKVGNGSADALAKLGAA